jgi:peptide/nickel transport system ATP-binding protein
MWPRGEAPSPLAPPSGCHYHPRCPVAADVGVDRCRSELPPLLACGAHHLAACHGVKGAPTVERAPG